jgi:hypothetical protein
MTTLTFVRLPQSASSQEEVAVVEKIINNRVLVRSLSYDKPNAKKMVRADRVEEMGSVVLSKRPRHARHISRWEKIFWVASALVAVARFVL